MRALLIASILTAGTASAAPTIFPAGGAVAQTPTLFITATQMPRIEVTDKRGPVQFEIDEMVVEGALRRIELRPQVADGPFTVTLDGKPIRFEADARLDHESDDAFFNVEFLRLATERARGRETLVIYAKAEPATILYFLNHAAPVSPNPDEFARYLYIGPGRTVGEGLQRYEVPLSALHVSCSGTAKIELSPYTTHVGGGSTTLYPIVTLEVARGQVKLPVGMLDYGMTPEWQPCSRALAVAPPKPPTDAIVDGSSAPGSMIMSSLDSIGHRSFESLVVDPPVLDEGDDEGTPWWLLPVSLAGIALLLWRATARAAA